MILVDDKQVEALEARRVAEEQLNVRCFSSGYLTALTMRDSKNHRLLMHLYNLRRLS
jgi:hypothetical protein